MLPTGNARSGPLPGVRGLQAKFTVPEELLAPEQIESGALPAGSAGRRYSRCAAQ